MTLRILAFALLACAAAASAAPPKTSPKASPPSDPATDAIDVDAMARAKDVDGAQPADADAPAPDAAPAETTTPAASAAEPAESPAPDDTSAPSDAPMPAEAPAASETPSSETASPAPAAMAAPPAQSDEEFALRSTAAGCLSRATNLLDDAEKADYGNATRDFDAKMRTDLPAPKFKQQWESLGQFGKLVARGQSHLGTGEGYTMVMIPLIFEKTNLVAQIACGSDGRIAGFHVTRAPKPQF